MRHRARRGALAALSVLAVCALAAPVVAHAAVAGDPAARWPADGPAVRTAEAIAATQWGTRPCAGQAGVLWEDLGGGLNAQASWSNLESQWDAPGLNTGCEVSLNRATTWDWPKLCTVLVHELGHLAGHDHVDDPRDVMFPEYVAPLAACEATPEPAPAAPSARTAGAKAAPKRTIPVPRRTAKRTRKTTPKR